MRMYQGECEQRRYTRKPVASITKAGKIRLNAAIVRALPSLRRVTMYADTDANPPKLVLKLVRDDEKPKLSRRLHEVGKTGLELGALGFLRWCGVDHGHGTRKYPAHYDEATRQIVITLEPGKGAREP